MDSLLGLLSLTDVDTLVIKGNSILTNIDGLSNLAVLPGTLSIFNPSLERYCGLSLLFDVQGVYWYFLIILDANWNNYYFWGNAGVLNLIGSPCELLSDEEEVIDPFLWIQGLLENGILNKGQANALLTKLEHGSIGALVNQLADFVESGILTEELAQPIVDGCESELFQIASNPSKPNKK